MIKQDVYTVVPEAECWEVTGRGPIGTKWVDVNKGDKVNPEYRSRLVAKEIKTDKRNDLFAATPPLEGKKLLFSLSVTEGIGHDKRNRKGGMKLDFIDIRRAFFHARANRPVYVKLPDEEYQPGMCGRLNKAMYGTRDAAQNWEIAYAEFMEEIGFTRGIVSPCVFWHPERELRVVVHGDDFTILGWEWELDCFKTRINERLENKHRG